MGDADEEGAQTILEVLLIQQMLQLQAADETMATVEKALCSSDVRQVQWAIKEGLNSRASVGELKLSEKARRAFVDLVSPASINCSFPWFNYAATSPAVQLATLQATSNANNLRNAPNVPAPQPSPPPPPPSRGFLQRLFWPSSASSAGRRDPASSSPRLNPTTGPASDPQLSLPSDTSLRVKSLVRNEDIRTADEFEEALELYAGAFRLLAAYTNDVNEGVAESLLNDSHRPVVAGLMRTLCAIPPALLQGGGQRIPRCPVTITNEASDLAKSMVMLSVNALIGLVAHTLKNHQYGAAQISQLERLMGGRAVISTFVDQLRIFMGNGSPKMKFQIAHIVALLIDTRLLPPQAAREIIWPFILWAAQSPLAPATIDGFTFNDFDVFPLMRPGAIDCHAFALLVCSRCSLGRVLREGDVFKQLFRTVFLQPWTPNGNNGLPNVLRPDVIIERTDFSTENAKDMSRHMLHNLMVLRDKLMLDHEPIPSQADINAAINALRVAAPSAPALDLLTGPMFSLTTNEDWLLNFMLGNCVEETEMVQQIMIAGGAIADLPPDDHVERSVADDLFAPCTVSLRMALTGFLMQTLQMQETGGDMRPLSAFLAMLCRCAFHDLAYMDGDVIAMLLEQDLAPWVRAARGQVPEQFAAGLANTPSHAVAVLVAGDIELVTGPVLVMACAHLVVSRIPVSLSSILQAMLWVAVDQTDFATHLLAFRSRDIPRPGGTVAPLPVDPFTKYLHEFKYYPKDISSASSVGLDDDDDNGSEAGSAAAAPGALNENAMTDVAEAIKIFLRRYRNAFPLKIEHTLLGVRHSSFKLDLCDDEYGEVLFNSTIKAMFNVDKVQMRTMRPYVKFRTGSGEEHEGIDAGGLTKHWLNKMGVQLSNRGKHLGLLIDLDESIVGQRIIHPLADLNPEAREFFAMMGKLMGICLANGDLQPSMPMGLSPVMYSLLLGKSLGAADYETLDRGFCTAVRNVITSNQDITALSLTMAVDVPLPTDVSSDDVRRRRMPGVTADSPGYASIEFEPDGGNQDVTTREQLVVAIENRARLFFGERCPTSYQVLISSFREVVPLSLLDNLDPVQLLIAIEGRSDIDIADWKANTCTKFNNIDRIDSLPQPVKQQIDATKQLFWAIVDSFDRDDRVKLLQFVCGTTRVPAGGFACLMHPFTLQFQSITGPEPTAPLPVAHVCFNRLDLPLFRSQAVFENKLRQAMSETAFHIR